MTKFNDVQNTISKESPVINVAKSLGSIASAGHLHGTEAGQSAMEGSLDVGTGGAHPSWRGLSGRC